MPAEKKIFFLTIEYCLRSLFNKNCNYSLFGCNALISVCHCISACADDETVYIPPCIVFQCGKMLLMEKHFGDYTHDVNAALLEVAETANLFGNLPRNRN